MGRKAPSLNRREFLKVSAVLGGVALACGQGQRLLEQTLAPTDTNVIQPSPILTSPPPPQDVVKTTPTAPGPQTRVITTNDFIPEQTNYIDTLVVNVNFSSRRNEPFDISLYWERIFGTLDPICQLNAYYNEVFYGQLQLRPVEVVPDGYVEVELEGTPQDYTFGWLIGMETEEIAAVDPEDALRLVLEVMTKVVQQHPEINYQDKFVLIVLNALGSEYGRGAAGVLPTGSVEPIYDMFIGDLAPSDQGKFNDPEHFRVLDGKKILGVIMHTGYTFDDYYRDRGERAISDQFLMGIGLFGKDAPLSCASHDILHGLRRKSAYANPPQGRARAVNCLYNLLLQSQWVVGNPGHGYFDRSVNVSPYIGWWDPLADHLHPAGKRDFFSSHPHGMCSFTKLRMGMIPERCVAIIQEDHTSLKLAPLTQPSLPRLGSQAEKLVARVPLIPGNPKLEHLYLLLEYRCRSGTADHPDNFSIAPDFVAGDKRWDPGYNPNNPSASRYINPPTNFVSKEGVLVYLVNEKIPEYSIVEYHPDRWYEFILVLLNPQGNANRSDLTLAALATGESMEVDCRQLYAQASLPVVFSIRVTNLNAEYAGVNIECKVQLLNCCQVKPIRL